MREITEKRTCDMCGATIENDGWWKCVQLTISADSHDRGREVFDICFPCLKKFTTTLLRNKKE